MDSSECPICGFDVPFTRGSHFSLGDAKGSPQAARSITECPGCGMRLIRNPDQKDIPPLQNWRTERGISDR